MTTELLAGAPSVQLSWNLIQDIAHLFDYAFSVNAFAAGTVVAIVAGAIGYFVVLRGLAFAGHALSHIGFAGAAGAVVVGLDAVAGVLVFTVGSGIIIGVLGNRLRDRDVVIGIVLAWMLGLGVLFISLYTGYATEAYAILFGDIYGVSTLSLVITLVAGVVTLTTLGVIYRPLLFASLDESVAAARGVPVRALSIVFMVLLAFAVSEAVQVVGVLLIFSLVVTPAAVAQRLTARPPVGIALSCILALLFTWVGLAIAYYISLPPSFFITSLTFVAYIGVRTGVALKDRAGRRRALLEAR